MQERQPNRLINHDYSENGYYFITICVKDKHNWFGDIVNDKIILNEYGEKARQCWLGIPEHFNYIKLDEYMIMPNHIHGIIMIDDPDIGNANNNAIVGNAYMRSLRGGSDRTKMKLSVATQQYKASVTREINKTRNGIKFQWQKSYYDHIIQNEPSLKSVREYIVNNPLNWALDEENMHR